MISEETIELIKQKTSIVEVIGDFLPIKKSGTNYTCCCPFHGEKSPSFTVNSVENFYKCFGCGRAGDSIKFLEEYKKWTFQQAISHLANKYKITLETTSADNQPKQYIKPEFKNHTELSDKVVKWFKDVRGISQSTLVFLKITESNTWMPEVIRKDKIYPAGNRNCINFNYFRDAELVNIKYRDSIKAFKLVKDAELIFYNLDSLKGAKEAWITEGEIEIATLIDCGIQKEGIGCVSVPNGANIKSNNMIYIDNCIDLFANIEKIHIASDDDIAGRKLREDLAVRFGKERCDYIVYKGKKDLNEVLVEYGITGVRECCADIKEFPIVGAFAPSTFSDDVNDMYVNGVDRGVGIGLTNFDKLLRFVPGYITVITGIPNMGKSDWLDQIALMLSIEHNWKFAFYSPENKPTKIHISKLARKLIGKNWFGNNKINELEKDLVMRYLEGKFWFIKPERDFSLDSILDTIKMLKMQKGITAFCLDAWNRLEHKYGGSMNETKYINESLTKLDNFCEMHNLHCFLVAHPSKMEKDKRTGKYMVPTLYNISGSAHFYNIVANGMCVYRDFDTNKTTVYVQKVKMQPYWGMPGNVEFKYDINSGRYNEFTGDNVIFDNSNWITKENQRNLDIPETVDSIIYDDGSEPPF